MVIILGWPLKPLEKYSYMGSPIRAFGENMKCPRGLPSMCVPIISSKAMSTSTLSARAGFTVYLDGPGT